MDFLHVVKGLEEGKVFTHRGFPICEYLVMDNYKQIKIFDGIDAGELELTTDLVLSREWKECKKQKRYILGTDNEVNLVTDEEFVYYVLSEENEDYYYTWNEICISKDELMEKIKYIDIQIGEKAVFTEEEREEITKILNQQTK